MNWLIVYNNEHVILCDYIDENSKVNTPHNFQWNTSFSDTLNFIRSNNLSHTFEYEYIEDILNESGEVLSTEDDEYFQEISLTLDQRVHI